MKIVKISLFAISVISAGLSSTFAATVIDNASGIIRVSGVVTSNTCVVSVDKNSLTFPTVTTTKLNELSPNTRISEAENINFTFTTCPIGIINFSLKAGSLIGSDVRKGALSFGAGYSDALYYQARLGSSSTMMNLNGITTGGGNQFIANDDSFTKKIIPVSIELIRGTGTASAASGNYNATMGYTISYS